MKLWKCSVCNYTLEGEHVEGNCPKCGAPASAFNELTEDHAKKVYMSDRTNDLLMKLDALCVEMVELAKEGIEINLDPPCLKTFTYARERAWEIKQMSKAEIENHIGKGKW